MKYNKFLIIIMLLCSLGSNAQVITLDSCFAMARRYNSDLQKASLDVMAAQEVKRQVFTKFFPTVDITGMAFYARQPIANINVKDFAQTSDFKDLLSFIYDFIREDNPEVSEEINWLKKGYTFGLKATQPIYAGGRIVTGNKLAQVGIEASQRMQQITERDVLQEIEETYWMICGLKEKRLTIADVNELLDTLSNVASTALDAGLVTRNDILKIELKRNEIASNSLRLENGIRLATHLLCHQIGIPEQDSLMLESFPEEEISTIQLAPTITAVGRPEYELLNDNVRAEKLRRRMTIGETLPTIGIGATSGHSDLFEHARTNTIGFAIINIPLLSWWETSHKIKEHNIKIKEAELKRDNLQGMLKLQNEQAYNALSEAAQLLRQHESAIRMAQDNYDITLMNYQAGMTTMTDLLQSQALLQQAQNNYTDARITYRTNLRRFNELNK